MPELGLLVLRLPSCWMWWRRGKARRKRARAEAAEAELHRRLYFRAASSLRSFYGRTAASKLAFALEIMTGLPLPHHGPAASIRAGCACMPSEGLTKAPARGLAEMPRRANCGPAPAPQLAMATTSRSCELAQMSSSESQRAATSSSNRAACYAMLE
jgi:hypothetical protein